jgi:hypothetical protein
VAAPKIARTTNISLESLSLSESIVNRTLTSVKKVGLWIATIRFSLKADLNKQLTYRMR